MPVGSVRVVTDLELRTLGTDAPDLAALGDLRTLAFGGPGRPPTVDQLTVPAERVVAAYEGTRLVGTVGVLDFEQWFGGRAVRCGGVAGVTVAPDHRGRGLARAMIAEAVGRMRAEGHVVSALYPTTASLYRSLGWEVAGWWAKRAVAVADLPRGDGAVTWEPADHADPVLGEVHRTMAVGRDGWVVPPADWWAATGRRRRSDPTPTWSWIGRRQATAVAGVVCRHRTSERSLFDLEVDQLVAVDGPALREALAFLGGNGTTADRVVTTLPERVVASHVAEGSRTRSSYDWPWMLRLVDLPAAVAARGWPAGLHAEVHLDVTGPPVDDPEGAVGRWVLEVDDGRATCEPGGDGTVRLSIGDLAALYAGGVDPAALAFDRRLRGADERTASLLRAAFAGTPTLPTFF